MKPLKAWITEKDQTVVMVAGPQVVGDTLVGYINGVYEEMPAAQLQAGDGGDACKDAHLSSGRRDNGCGGWNDLRAHWWGRAIRRTGARIIAMSTPKTQFATAIEHHREIDRCHLSFRSLETLLRRTAAVASLCLLTVLAASAQAQVHMVIDSKGSLAWWQIDPNMAHLWGTTCPQEPSWRAGEGRSGGWTTEEAMQCQDARPRIQPELRYGQRPALPAAQNPLYLQRSDSGPGHAAGHGEVARGARGR